MAVKLAMNAERAAEAAYRIAGLRRKAAALADASRKPTESDDPAGRTAGQHPARDPDTAGSTGRREPRRHY